MRHGNLLGARRSSLPLCILSHAPGQLASELFGHELGCRLNFSAEPMDVLRNAFRTALRRSSPDRWFPK